MTDEVFDGPDMVGQLFGECQRVTHQTGDALPQGVVEALKMIGVPELIRFYVKTPPEHITWVGS
jgi:hypothetical protein